LEQAPHQGVPVVETKAVPFLQALLRASLEPALVSPLDEPQAPCSRVRQQALGEPRRTSAHQQPVVQRSARMA